MAKMTNLEPSLPYDMANALANALARAFPIKVNVDALVVESGPTCWYYVSIPARWTVRCGDFFAGWRAAHDPERGY